MLSSWSIALPRNSVWATAVGKAISISWFLALAAHIKVFCYPVPMTMQTWAIVLVALLVRPRMAIGAVILYIAQGIVGFPGFPESNILTWGYLVGFLAMTGVITFLVERSPSSSFRKRLGFVLVGHGVLYACGLAWLAHGIGWLEALQVGLYPFVILDLAKAALAVYMSKAFCDSRQKRG